MANGLRTLLIGACLTLVAASPADVQRRLQEATDAMDSARTLLARGEDRSAGRRLEEAEDIYRDILADNAEQRDAAIGLSAVYFLQKRYQAGADLMRPFYERMPDDPDVSHQLGLHLYRNGEHALAVPLLEAIAQDMQRFDAMWLLIQHYYRQADWETGLAHAERYLKARPDDTEALALIGTYFLKARQFDRAVATLDRFLESHPGNVSARINRANALFRRGDIDPAGQEYELLLEEEPERSRFMYNLAAVRIKQNRCEEALLLLDRFLAKEKENGPALYFRADCLFKLGRYPEARAAFESAGTTGQAANPWIWYGLSHVALSDGDLDGAINYAKKAQDLGPNDAELAAWLGTVYRKAKRASEALPWHDKAVGLAPEHAPYHVERGYDLWLLERVTETLGAFAKARELDPSHTEAARGVAAARTALGVEAWEKGDAEGAATHFSEALAADAGFHVARANLVIVDQSLGKTAAASALLTEAPPAANDHADIHAARALMRLVAGAPDEALELCASARANGTGLVQTVAQVEGQAAAAGGDWDRATRAFDEAHQLAPTPALEHARSQAWLELGLEKLARGDPARAREALVRARRTGGDDLDPEDRQTVDFALQVLTVMATDDPARAARNLAGALAGVRYRARRWARERDIGQGYVAYGWLRAGNAAEARKALARVRERGVLGAAWESLSSTADDVEARKLFKSGDYAGAARIWSAMIERGNRDPAVANNLGAAQFMLGRSGEAEGLWRPLADSGTPSEALYNLGNALGRRGEHRAAWELFQRYRASGGAQAERAGERADVKARLFGFGGDQ